MIKGGRLEGRTVSRTVSIAQGETVSSRFRPAQDCLTLSRPLLYCRPLFSKRYKIPSIQPMTRPTP